MSFESWDGQSINPLQDPLSYTPVNRSVQSLHTVGPNVAALDGGMQYSGLVQPPSGFGEPQTPQFPSLAREMASLMIDGLPDQQETPESTTNPDVSMSGNTEDIIFSPGPFGPNLAPTFDAAGRDLPQNDDMQVDETEEDAQDAHLPRLPPPDNAGDEEELGTEANTRRNIPDSASNVTADSETKAAKAIHIERITDEDELAQFGLLPPESTAIKNPYGHILGTVKPCRPEANEPAFIVEAKDRAAAVPSLPESLDPPPYTSDPPSGYSYPHSPHWNLDRNDTHYRSNVCYAANVSSEYGNIEREFQEQSSLTNPPGVDPTFDGERGVYVDGAPEGMVKMVAGIPMRLDIDGGKKGTKTYACHHTLASIQTMYPDIYDEVLEISQELRLCVFGRAPSTPKGKDGVRPLYTYEFMRQNHRSQKRGQATRVEAGISENYNGSYSLASTIAEGNALGTLVPALQVGYDAARDQIKKVLTLLRRLYLLLGPRSMTKFEWEVVQFHLDDNNVFSFTGLKHGGIAVQFNLSCGLSGGDLMRYIGRLQGTWHVDAKDALAILGMFVLMLRLPANAHEGSFLLGRYGCYIREAGVWIVFMFFNGRDMHSGRNVSVDGIAPDSKFQQDMAALSAEWEKAGEPNRAGFVVYFPSQAVHRTGGISVTPATIFSNHGSLTRSATQTLNYAQHGLHLLGSLRDASTRHALEAIFAFFNTLAQAGILMPGFTATSMIQAMKFSNPDTSANEDLVPPTWDALNPDHREHVWKWRGYYAYLHSVACVLDLHITRLLHKHKHKKLIHSHMEQMRGMTSNDPALSTRILPVSLKEKRPFPPPVSTHQSIQSPAAPRLIAAASHSTSRSSSPTLCSSESLQTTSTPTPLVAENGRTLRSSGNKRPAEVVDGLIDQPGPSKKAKPGQTSPQKKTKSTNKTGAASGKGKGPATLSSRKDAAAGGATAARSKTKEAGTLEKAPLKGVVGEDYRIGGRWYAEYWVEKIRSHWEERGIIHYEVQFKGYDSSWNMWYKEADLSNSESLVQAYKVQNALNQRRVHVRAAAGSHRLEHLGSWLDQDALQGEYDRLNDRFTSIRTDASYYKGPGKSMQSWISGFMKLNSDLNHCTGFLQCSPVDDRTLDENHSTSPQGRSVHTLLLRAVSAAQSYPQAVEQSLLQDIVSASVRWQECRSLIILNDFLRSGVKAMVKVLTHAYNVGPAFLSEHYGQYSELVSTIFAYLKQIQYPKADQTVAAFVEVPWDLHGLRSPDHSATSAPRAPVQIIWPRKTITHGSEYLNEAVAQCLENLLIDELVLPHLRSARERVIAASARSKKPIEKYTRKELTDGCKLRGRLLECIIEELDGESVCATKGIRLILDTPKNLFDPKISTESTLLSRIDDNVDGMLEPIRMWLANNVTSGVKNIAVDIAKFINHRMVEFHLGRKVSATMVENPALVPKTKPKAPGTGGKKRPTLDEIPITINDILCDDLVKKDQGPSLGVLGLILRETLNEITDQPYAKQQLLWLLQGRDPGNGRRRAAADRDQTDPVREHNVGAKLLASKLPGSKLTTEVGLSNLLSWTGTGQGNKTSSFLDAVGSFYSRSLGECVGMFGGALKVNQGYLALFGYPLGIDADIETPPADMPMLLQISNSCIYGSSCNCMKLAPTARGDKTLSTSVLESNRFDLVTKFGPFWEKRVRDEWVKFLGDMLDQDPATFEGERQSWSDCIRTLMKLGIPGFMSGLTVMQAANALAFARVINPPTLDELTNWIWSNGHLGAAAGLTCMGFKLPNRKSVLVALTCVHRHLDKHFVAEDKKKLGFGVIGVEHYLCKVSRWQKRVPEIKKWATDAEMDDEFVSGANSNNHLAYPMPLKMDKSFVAKVLAEVEILYAARK